MGNNTEHAIIERNRRNVDADDNNDDDKNVDLSLQTRNKSVCNNGVKIHADNYQ